MVGCNTLSVERITAAGAWLPLHNDGRKMFIWERQGQLSKIGILLLLTRGLPPTPTYVWQGWLLTQRTHKGNQFYSDYSDAMPPALLDIFTNLLIKIIYCWKAICSVCKIRSNYKPLSWFRANLGENSLTFQII